MGHQSTVILFCALLLSTFGHEHSRWHQGLPQSSLKHQGIHNPYLISRWDSPNSSNEVHCQWECPTLPSPLRNASAVIALNITVNATAKWISGVNVTTAAAKVLDLANNLSAVFNGSSGEVAVVNLTSGNGVYLGIGISKIGWFAANETFLAYTSRLTSIKAILEVGLREGVSFDRHGHVPEVILKSASQIISKLGSDYAVLLPGTHRTVLGFFVDISVDVASKFRGPCDNFLNLFGTVTFGIQDDIQWIAQIFQGLGNFVRIVKGGADVLLKNNITFDLEAITKEKTATDVLAYLVTVVKTKLDINLVLGEALNNQIGLLNILDKLSGGKHYGNVIFEVAAFAHGKTSPEALVLSLINFSITNVTAENGNWSEQWNLAFKRLYNVTKELNDCQSFLQQVNEKNWIVNNFNISEVREHLHTLGTIRGLPFVFKILASFKSILPLEVSIPIVVKNLIEFLEINIGVRILNLLIPNSNIIQPNNSISVLPLILKNVTISNLLETNTLEILRRLPIISKFICSVATVLNTEAQGKPALSYFFATKNGKKVLLDIRGILIAAIKIQEGKHLSDSEQQFHDYFRHANKKVFEEKVDCGF